MRNKEVKAEFKIDLPKEPLTRDQIVEENKKRYENWNIETYGRLRGRIRYLTKGRRQLLEHATDVIRKGMEVEKNAETSKRIDRRRF